MPLLPIYLPPQGFRLLIALAFCHPALQYAALEARAQQLQNELTAAYKEKASAAEASLQATRQLQVCAAPILTARSGCFPFHTAVTA